MLLSVWLALIPLPAQAEDQEEEEAPADHESLATYRPTPPTLVRTLDAEEVYAMPGALGDPVRALVNLPGFQRVPLESGFLLVRGSGPGDSGVYLDGVRQPLLFHLGGYTSVIHPDLVSGAEFAAGAWSARYGGITSGAVVLHPAQTPEQTSVRAGVNLVWSEALVEAPLGRGWGVWVAGRRSYLDKVLGLVFDFDSSVPTFGDVQLRLANEDFAFTVVGLSDALSFAVPNNDRAEFGRRSLQAQARGTTRLGAGDLEFAGWTSALESSAEHPWIADTERILGAGGRVSWDLAPDPWGVAGGLVTERSAWRLVSDLEEGRDGPVGRVDPWVEVALDRSRIYALTGLRADTLLSPGQAARVGLSPRASVGLRLGRGLTLVADAGRFHQAPPTRLLVGVEGAEELPLERADAASVALAWNRSSLALDAALYVRRMRMVEVLNDGSGLWLQGRARGLEVQARHRGEVWETRALVTASLSDRREDEELPWTPWRYQQGLQVSLMGSRELSRGWFISVRARAASGYYLDADAYEAHDFASGRSMQLEAKPSGRLEPWYAVDAKVGRARDYRRFTLRTWLDIQNATDYRVPEPILTGILDTEPIYSFGLFILPVFGIDGTWHPAEVKREE